MRRRAQSMPYPRLGLTPARSLTSARSCPLYNDTPTKARDLRLLDLTSATPPAILDRDKAIIVNLWAIKVRWAWA